jgi:hypothetical protein
MARVLVLWSGATSALFVALATFLRLKSWKRIGLIILMAPTGALVTSVIFCALGPDFMHTGYAVSFTFLIAISPAFLGIPFGLSFGALIKFVISLFWPHEPYK